MVTEHGAALSAFGVADARIAQEARRDVAREPNAVGRAEELVALRCHLSRRDLEHDGSAAALGDEHRQLTIR